MIKHYVKWPLFVITLLLVIINYFAFIDVITVLLNDLNEFFRNHHYYLDSTKPILLLLKILPSYFLIEYIINMNNKNYLQRIKNIYNVVNICQLVVLIVILPFLLFVQNNFYYKISKK